MKNILKVFDIIDIPIFSVLTTSILLTLGGIEEYNDHDNIGMLTLFGMSLIFLVLAEYLFRATIHGYDTYDKDWFIEEKKAEKFRIKMYRYIRNTIVLINLVVIITKTLIFK